ncbi:helix-turn-helix domain-containing protein [Saccharothrix sp. Mg75]|uniref:helix-turn-helix domain-containing protein n=1 Tax=Saccharothrix sp. Mg75 TaxID=3445357 RepID=UPI003EEA0187
MAEQWRLRTEIKKARERRRLTQKDVAAELDWSPSKVVRMENGQVGVSVTDLRALLQLYGVTDEQVVGELVDLAKAKGRRAWWDEYRDHLGPTMVTLLGLEGASSLVRQFEALVVPGVLQTEAYARTVLSLYHPPERVAPLTAVRLERQKMLLEQIGVEGFFILDEAAIRRWVGGPEVIREQLEHLKEVNRQPNITVQVITFDRGVHQGMHGSFSVYEFPSGDQDRAVFVERPGGTNIVQNDPDTAKSYVETFMELERLAVPAAELDQVVDRVLGEMLGG